MTKAEIIKELEKLEIEFDPKASKDDLEQLLSEVTETEIKDEEEKEPVEELPKKDNNESKYGVGKVFTPANL